MNWSAIWQRAWGSLQSFYSPGIIAGLAVAFLIAGALNVFVPKAFVLRFLGARSNKFLAYSLAIAAGIILSV